MSDKRIHYYDMARGLGILFVVMGHVECIYAPLRQYVTYFHMALFLMISGMLLLQTGEETMGWKQIIKKKIHRILLPYFLFSILSMVIETLRRLTHHMEIGGEMGRQLFQTLCLQGISVLWFLPALFISELIFLAVRKLLCGREVHTAPEADGESAAKGPKTVGKDILTAAVVAGLTVAAIFCNRLEQEVYKAHGGILFYELLHDVLSMLIRGIFCTVFVGCGYFVRKYYLTKDGRKGLLLAAGGILLIVCGYMNLLNPEVDLRAMRLGNSVPYLAGAVSGALGIILICRALDSYCRFFLFRILMYFGCNSLLIMATHLDWHIVHYSLVLGEYCSGFIQNPVFLQCAVLVLVFAAEAAIIEMINKFFPLLVGKHKIKKVFS